MTEFWLWLKYGHERHYVVGRRTRKEQRLSNRRWRRAMKPLR